MKIGDLVKWFQEDDLPGCVSRTGIVVEMISHPFVPTACRVLWPNGSLEKDWVDELEVVNESR